MKVALVIYFFTDVKGGVERYTYGLAKGLLSKGIEVHIYAHKWRISEPSLQLFFHKVPAMGFYTAFKVLSFAKNSAEMLKNEHYDVINGFGRTYYQDVYRVGGGCHIEYLKRTHPGMANPFLRFFILNNPRNAAIVSVEKRTFKKDNYKKIICNSQLSKNEVRQYYNVPEEDIEVIYNGVDTEKFHPRDRVRFRDKLRRTYGIKENDLVVLFAGTGFERKGLKYAIDTVALLRHQHPVKLFVTGKDSAGPYRADLKKMKMPETVYFLGWRDDIQAVYASSDAFFLPTLSDSFANACLEAMSAGLPVVTTTSNGASEIIREGVNGYVINSPADTEGAANKLKTLFDEKTRTQMSENARKTALEYSTETNLQKVVALYEQIVKMKRG